MIFHEVQNVGGGGWLGNRICCRLVRAVFILVPSYLMSIADEMMRNLTKRTRIVRFLAWLVDLLRIITIEVLLRAFFRV